MENNQKITELKYDIEFLEQRIEMLKESTTKELKENDYTVEDVYKAIEIANLQLKEKRAQLATLKIQNSLDNEEKVVYRSSNKKQKPKKTRKIVIGAVSLAVLFGIGVGVGSCFSNKKVELAPNDSNDVPSSSTEVPVASEPTQEELKQMELENDKVLVEQQVQIFLNNNEIYRKAGISEEFLYDLIAGYNGVPTKNNYTQEELEELLLNGANALTDYAVFQSLGLMGGVTPSLDLETAYLANPVNLTDLIIRERLSYTDDLDSLNEFEIYRTSAIIKTAVGGDINADLIGMRDIYVDLYPMRDGHPINDADYYYNNVKNIGVSLLRIVAENQGLRILDQNNQNGEYNYFSEEENGYVNISEHIYETHYKYDDCMEEDETLKPVSLVTQDSTLRQLVDTQRGFGTIKEYSYNSTETLDLEMQSLSAKKDVYGNAKAQLLELYFKGAYENDIEKVITL